MKKASEIPGDDPLDHEIDFSRSRPNPYWLGMVDRRCVRLLESDLADAFPDDAAVNKALRTLIRSNPVATPKKISAKTVTLRKPKKARA